MSSKTQLAVVALLIGFAVFLILSKSMWWKETPSIDREPSRRCRSVSSEERTSPRARLGAERARGSRAPRAAPCRRSAWRRRRRPEPPRMGTPRISPSSRSPTGPRAPATRSPRPDARVALAGLMDNRSRRTIARSSGSGSATRVSPTRSSRSSRSGRREPKGPRPQTQLGNAYLEKMQECRRAPSRAPGHQGRSGLRQGARARPRALGARFMKAVALSFWPAAFGKGGEAIKHFETLVSQQERQNPRTGSRRPTISSGTCISRPASAIRRSRPGSAASSSSPTTPSSGSSSRARGR